MNTIDETEAEQDRQEAAARDAAMDCERDTQAAIEDAAFARQHGGRSFYAYWCWQQDELERGRPERERLEQVAQEQAERDRVEAERIKQEAMARAALEREQRQQAAKEQAAKIWAQKDREHAQRYGPPPAFRFKTRDHWKPETPVQQAALEVATKYPWFGPEDAMGVHFPNMVISGPTGTGKTLLASIVFEDQVDYRPIYITATELVRQFRQKDRPEAVLLAQYGRGEFEAEPWDSELLIVDDVGIGADPYAAQVMCEILDQRMGEELQTVVTTNATDSELATWLGERGYSRLRKGCKWVQLDGRDRRLDPPT